MGNSGFVLRAVQCRGEALAFAHESLRDDKAIVLAAVENEPMALRFESPRLRANKCVIMRALERDWQASKHILAWSKEQLNADNKISQIKARHDAAVAGAR